MSFLHPDAIAKFKSVQSFLLWFQMAYSIWQFIRTAKFFRLPYVTLSSSWHGFDSWYKTRKLILMLDEVDVDKDAVSEAGPQFLLSSPHPGMTIDEVGDYNVEVSFFDLQTPAYYTCLTSKQRAAHMVLLQNYKRMVQFGRDDDLLWPKVHLIRRLSFEDAVSHVLSGKGYATGPQVVCFFDYSSRELLNQNFLRFASIWPLILQARHYDFWSIVFSLFVILMDVLSYGANKLWRFVQYWISRLVKVVVLQFSNRETRVFLFTFMGSISKRFVCYNFVTEEASSKVVKRVLLATHIKFDKSKVATLDPILSTIEVPKKEGNQEPNQTVQFAIAGVQYSALVQPRFSEQSRSSVHFNKPSSINIKVKDWAIEDMAYFLQVCDHCNEFKSSPIKELDENNTAVCSSFAEIVHGVKTRNFVLCEFKTPQRLFFT